MRSFREGSTKRVSPRTLKPPASHQPTRPSFVSFARRRLFCSSCTHAAQVVGARVGDSCDSGDDIPTRSAADQRRPGTTPIVSLKIEAGRRRVWRVADDRFEPCCLHPSQPSLNKPNRQIMRTISTFYEDLAGLLFPTGNTTKPVLLSG